MTTQDRCLPCAARDRNRAATPGYQTCDGCSADIHADLIEIRDRYARLNPAEKEQADHAGVRSVPRSKSPANDHVLSMMDPRSTSTGRAYAPPATLGTWAQAVEEESGYECREWSVPGLTRYLADRHAWVTAQPWVDDYARELHELVLALRPVTGEPRPRPIGRCPEVLKDEHGDPVGICDTPLLAPLHGDTIKCRGCAREWPRAEWLRLGTILEAS